MDDPFDLQRFVDAQRGDYERALGELREGVKRSHWVWYVFPQLVGLGHSEMARRYGISGVDEARAYLAHPLLGERLETCAAAVLEHRGRAVRDIMGSPDHLKLRSCMTLFTTVAPQRSVFHDVLEAFYEGNPDQETLSRLLG